MDMVQDTSLVQLSENIWSIDQGFVRSFLIVGSEKALLFDTGAEPCDLMRLLRSVTALPITLVQSHGDGDHTANSFLFPTIWAHPAEFEVILRFRPELAGRLQPVSEGDVFDLGGCVLEVVEAPGHTPGSICLIDRARRALFAGDTVSLGPVFLFGDHRDIRTYRRTLDKLGAMGGYDIVYPCHNACPVSPSILPDLIAAADGAMSGASPGAETDGPPMPDGAKPLCYTVGDCGVLYLP